jgi:superfamily II DNA or RNA helicase
VTAQGALFEPRTPAPTRDAVVLRPYQVEAVRRIQEEFKGNQSTLLVMATGTGKTATFSDVIDKTDGRVLVLAHRDELVQQAVSRIERQTGRRVGIEKADLFASTRDDVVVASVQTLYQEKRLSRFPVDSFALVVADEAHHYVAPSFRRVLDYFEAKVLGVTATPDRADRLAMGQVFDSVAYVYDIEDAIGDGFLCPIRATSVLIESMSLADVKTVAGDLNQGDLDAVMSAEKVLHGVAKPTVELAGDRRTLVFSTSVQNAHRLAEVFCRYKPESARAVDGSMDMDLRRQILADHKAGRFQYLVNVGIATEGYDDPAIACVAMGRPTKSRALYTQMVGRGTRILPGKSDLLVLDFVGNAGKHSLVSAVDVLAGKYSDEVVAKAKEIVEREPGIAASEALAAAEAQVAREKEAQEAAERRRAARAKVAYRTQNVNPFAIFNVQDPAQQYGGQFGGKPASDKQLALLAKRKVPVPDNCTSQQASRLIGAMFQRQERGLCTFGQMKTLQRYGYDTSEMSFEKASATMDALAKNGWQRLPEERPANATLGDW